MSVGAMPPAGDAASLGSLMAELLIKLTGSPNDLPQNARPTSMDIQLISVGPVFFVLSGVSGDTGVSSNAILAGAHRWQKGSFGKDPQAA